MSQYIATKQVEPTTPGSNKFTIYQDSADGITKVKKDTGTVVPLEGGGGAGDFLGLTDVTDSDYTGKAGYISQVDPGETTQTLVDISTLGIAGITSDILTGSHDDATIEVQVIPHMLGVVPETIIFHATASGADGGHSHGAYTNGTGENKCNFMSGQTNLTDGVDGNNCIRIQDESAGDFFTGQITAVTASDFSISWTRSGGTPVGFGSLAYSAILIGNSTTPSGVSSTKGVTPVMNTASLVVVDTNSTATSVITWTAQTTPSGFIEIIPGAGSFTINSTATETGLIFNYVITN